MGWLGNKFNRWATDAQSREISDFIGKLDAMDSEEIGLLVAIAFDYRNMLLDTQQIDLLTPSVVLLSKPLTAFHLGGTIKALQRDGSFMAAAGLMVWVHTLRAMTELALRPLGRVMWSQLSRGFDHAVPSAVTFREMAGKSLNLSGVGTLPSGLGTKT